MNARYYLVYLDFSVSAGFRADDDIYLIYPSESGIECASRCVISKDFGLGDKKFQFFFGMIVRIIRNFLISYIFRNN